MPDPSITLRAATRDDLDRIVSLLDENDLPSSDVRSKSGCFLIAWCGTAFVGIAGLEAHAPVGLLRSVVIDESRRGLGYGSALVDALEEHARADQVETLYLLTTTAAGFFRRAGYEEIARGDVPPSIEATSEFTDLCPSTATCMMKDVGRQGTR